MKILIFAAFRKEVGALVEAMGLPDSFRNESGGMRWTGGRFSGHDVAVIVTGMGQSRSVSSARSAFETFEPDRVVACGTAGSLAPAVEPLDIVVANRVCAWDGGPAGPDWIFADAETAATLARACKTAAAGRIHVGGLLSLGKDLRDSSERQALWERTGALAVDMETAFLLQAARSEGVPAAAVRVVSDRAGENAKEEFHRNLRPASEALAKVLTRYVEEETQRR